MIQHRPAVTGWPDIGLRTTGPLGSTGPQRAYSRCDYTVPVTSPSLRSQNNQKPLQCRTCEFLQWTGTVDSGQLEVPAGSHRAPADTPAALASGDRRRTVVTGLVDSWHRKSISLSASVPGHPAPAIFSAAAPATLQSRRRRSRAAAIDDRCWPTFYRGDGG